MYPEANNLHWQGGQQYLNRTIGSLKNLVPIFRWISSPIVSFKCDSEFEQCNYHKVREN